MVSLVNQARQKAGLPALQVDMNLVRTARAKSTNMVQTGTYEHGNSLDIVQSSTSYRFVGENIAGNSSVSGAHQSLMNSPGHRANILSKNYTHIGIGIVNGGPYGKAFTQQFGG